MGYFEGSDQVQQVLLGQKEATARIRGVLEGMDQMTLCL